MNSTYMAVIKQNADWWIGWVEEVPGVNAQAATKEELMEDLRLALTEAIEMNRADALIAAESGYEEVALQM